MPDWSIEPSESVIICTRNRPEALAKTLQSVAEQTGAEDRLVLVIDGSDSQEATSTADVVQDWSPNMPFYYSRYSGEPAGTRQRNAGIDLLPDSVAIVHFIDDDVTLAPDYFDTLSTSLQDHPSVLGVGGLINHPNSESPSFYRQKLLTLFLLSTDTPSRVLPSGHTSPARATSGDQLQPAEWLSTCASSYRRTVFQTHRFDPSAVGASPRLEDLDFSYRVSQNGPLAVAPDARCRHRVSQVNRRTTAEKACERIIRRYWFLTKNMDSPANRLAFWWSVVGKLLIRTTSTNPDSPAALRGLINGIRDIWTQNHALLDSAE